MFHSSCDCNFTPLSFRFVRHCVRLAGGQREGHSVYWWPYFWRHPEVQETSRLEDIPGYTWAGAGAARVDGQELWDKRTHRDTCTQTCTLYTYCNSCTWSEITQIHSFLVFSSVIWRTARSGHFLGWALQVSTVTFNLVLPPFTISHPPPHRCILHQFCCSLLSAVTASVCLHVNTCLRENKVNRVKSERLALTGHLITDVIYIYLYIFYILRHKLYVAFLQVAAEKLWVRLTGL